MRCASCLPQVLDFARTGGTPIQTGQSVIPLYDSGYSVGSRHSTHSAYGGPSAFGGFGTSTIVQ